MSRGQQTFRQSDLTKAVKGMVKAGLSVSRAEIERTGKIVVVAATPQNEDGDRHEENEWDEVLP
jgi:hypothetical protein